MIALSFIVATSAMLFLIARACLAPGAFSSSPLRMVIGAAGWVVMLSACAVVVVHPKPSETFLGRFAFMKEPLLGDDVIEPRRRFFTIFAITLALVSVTVCVLFFTGAINSLFERYVFAK